MARLTPRIILLYSFLLCVVADSDIVLTADALDDASVNIASGNNFLPDVDNGDDDDKQRAKRHLFGFGKKPEIANAASAYGNTGGYGSVNAHSGYGFGGHFHHAHNPEGPQQGQSPYGMGQVLNFLGLKKNAPVIPGGATFQLEPQGMCGAYPLPSNVQHSCRNVQCLVHCPMGYSFPNGQNQLKLSCIGGLWIMQDANYEAVPPCQANCIPPCENNGICLEPGVCKCAENFYGPLCQQKRTVCPLKPPIPRNSKVSCLNNMCNAQCMRGFQFPDGSTINNIECRDGQWLHVQSASPKPPDCAPTCAPACENGGQCVSFNVCQCTKLYRGSHCQHSIAACNISRTDFNGNYKCNYDSDFAKCVLSCPQVPGVKVHGGQLDVEYKCDYDTGKFTPETLPKCIYPPGYVIRKGPAVGSFNREPGVLGNGTKGGGVVDNQTQREKLLDILAKLKDLDRKSEWWDSEETVITPSSYLLYTTNDVNVTFDSAPRASMCATWGGNNIKTFDGLIFKAPLSCSHTLINDKIDATFDITLKGCAHGAGYGCAHTLKIYWQSVLYTIEKINGTMRLSTPTKQLPLPAQLMGMKVLPVAQHLQIELDAVGLKLDWDQQQYLALYASPMLWHKVGGLCGSLDGDSSNDLMSKRGVVVETTKSFTDSWRVTNNDERCAMQSSAELEFGSEHCAPAQRKQAVEICERLLMNEKLEPCIKSFNFAALLGTCVDDYCNCPNRAQPQTCNCDAVAMLAKECAFMGITLAHGWRNLEICPISCAHGRIYQSCGPDFEATCESDLQPTMGKCNEGCFCPAGTVQYKDTCINRELCPCALRGREFKTDEVIKQQCNTCKCNAGRWTCSEEQCGARCGAIGDPHYQTFDGKRYDFMGKCSYYLLKMPNMSVEAENIACSGAISEAMQLAASADEPSCTKSLTLRFNLKNGASTTIKLGQELRAHVNGKELTKYPKVLGAGEVLLRRISSTFMTVEFPEGIRVWWDGATRAYIDVPPSFRNKTAGLCGTFNANTQDDFRTPEGDVESAVEPFADKWRTKDSCEFLVDTPSGPHPCSANPAQREIAEKHCAWLTEDVFQDCHWTVEPEQYYEDCLYDVCACKQQPEQCYCPILSAYGTECMRQGVKTGWRLAVEQCAIQCPMGQIYEECGDSCTLTCADLPAQQTCKRECVEGCRCPHGEYLNEQGECVPESKCHCTYEGMTFKPGYKEVRPGAKVLDLCTCKDGLWACEDAETGDEARYPPASELRAQCDKTPYMLYDKCAPTEPKSCKNMHEYKPNAEDCAPGCVCAEGYVWDAYLRNCVLPDNCSCHHAGKSYEDGAQMQEDCNVCNCTAGKWQCTQHDCDTTCSVWGDSHFTSFDGHDFDFQGACDYVLSKGTNALGDGYLITVHNVLCGTMGVTCSKSLELSLSGRYQDSIVLAADASYNVDPHASAIEKLREGIHKQSAGGDHSALHIYKAGVFVVVEVIPLHLQIKWDEGTRVYVKLGKEWREKVSGLCGNYNGNMLDDMQSPMRGLETNALIFGHAWRTQPYCTMPTEPIDACKAHPERETWAQLKCGVLKSAELFQQCHGEVPVEPYLKRCTYDACACDQGGDCECLCTAVAAYAHACAQKGISIRWRTPHFCPLQCDARCSTYEACTPACAIETCDNFLDQGIAERMCVEEQCIEGCQLKPCDEGYIYRNDSYRECVPKSSCKPLCMLRDEVTYYEGDITYQDACATCRCSKKKEVCSGVKCALETTSTTTTTTAPFSLDMSTIVPATEQQPKKCVRGWTRWQDKDSDTTPSMTIRLNDVEPLPRYDRLERIYGTCQQQYMTQIECRVVDTHEPAAQMDEHVVCKLQQGLACIGSCHDYELRVFCECDELPATTETATPVIVPLVGIECKKLDPQYKEYPADCHKFLQCTPNTVSSPPYIYVEKTCGDTMMFNPLLNICDHIANVKGIKPSCGNAKRETKPLMCPLGQQWSDCANHCEHTCHFYGMVLQKRGICTPDQHCQPGCVPSDSPDCPKSGKYWRDESTCVDADQCPCMDKTDLYVLPHMPVLGDTELCQCIDNTFTCVPNKMIEHTTAKAPLQSTEAVPHIVFPNTLTPPLQCVHNRLVPLIEAADQPLPDNVFNASTQLSPAHAPREARLQPSKLNAHGCWSPRVNDQMQYLQISFAQPEPIFGVISSGSPDTDNYVTLFKILYSHDGEAYHYLVDENDNPQLFPGPLDSRDLARTLFQVPIEAKSVRIYPLKWHNSIAMRVELLGCGVPESTTTTTTERPTQAPPSKSEPLCIEPLGIENEALQEAQLKASSIWRTSASMRAEQKPRMLDLLKLSSPVGWRPLINTPNEFIEFNFLEPRNVSGFIVKGGPDGWVKGYKLLFSKNRLTWNHVLGPNGEEFIFQANHDADTESKHHLKMPIMTQYMRIMPTSWVRNINMRVEPIGCFVPYPSLKEELEPTQTPRPCNICEGVLGDSNNSSGCQCSDALYWNGTDCITHNLCPCVENYVSYPVGTTYENTNCESCVCVLGGHKNCKPKKCAPCETNLRPLVSSGCYCTCAPCPKEQRLCPSSGDCIPEVLWCNGVQDCADDEDASCTDTFTVEPERTLEKNKTITLSCAKPACPPGMKLKIVDKKKRNMSKMFSSSFSKQLTIIDDGNRITKTKLISSKEEFTPTASEELETEDVDTCLEFTCMPLPQKMVNITESVKCTEPKCPENYDIELDRSTTIKPDDCPKYTCILRPTKDDVCELSGKTITTFDGTEFKYDTCSHILARDTANASWSVSVQLKCSDATRKICRKIVILEDHVANKSLVIMPAQKLNFNGFDFTVQQLINSPICKASFVISQLGNSVLVVSTKHGFWVLYDDIGYIKLGVSSKYIGTVDGLCGYYNGQSADDKRAPNGTLLLSTQQYGDSWSDGRVPLEQCYPQLCPLEVQRKALALCNTIKQPSFVQCNKAVNYKQFVSKCIETTCTCLQEHNGDIAACKCQLLQDFVRKCLTVQPHAQLYAWRAQHQCELKCPAPLVHTDCYKRRCEPACEKLNNDDCPIIEDACFPGCYCPEGTVRKGDNCVSITDCKDCVCESLGRAKYRTYDRRSFDINGNCTYLLSRDIVLPGVHNFQVYVTMDDCSKLGQQQSTGSNCAKSLHVLNGDHVIHIQRMRGAPQSLQLFVDGFEIKQLPYTDSWLRLAKSGKQLLLSLPETHVELTASFDELLFTLGVPSIKYGNKMEGLCGDCNGDGNNDLQPQTGTTSRTVLNSWRADEPKLGLPAHEQCLDEQTPQEQCMPLPPEQDPCLRFFDESLFGKCPLVVEPVAYVSACQADLCKPGNDQAGVCAALSAYARECQKHGICVNWRRPTLCPYECPANMRYEPCGCARTCDTVKELAEFDAINMTTNTLVKTLSAAEEQCPLSARYEGCFCTPGQALDNGTCVPERNCTKCSDGVHLPGEHWQRDKCTSCTCDLTGSINCVQKKCLVEENICAEGYTPQRLENESECCARYRCVPELKLPSSKVCLAPLMPDCGYGQYKKMKTGADGCPQYICECKPKSECPQLAPAPALKPGERLYRDDTGCCPLEKILCDKLACPPRPTDCLQFHEVSVVQNAGDCCPSYKCVPPKNLCIVSFDAQQYTKRIGEQWQEPTNPCALQTCRYGPNGTTIISTTLESCHTACAPGYSYVHNTTSHKCCGECVQTACVYGTQLYAPGASWQSADNCTHSTCVRNGEVLVVSEARQVCPDVSKCPAEQLVQAEGGCCQLCKPPLPKPENLSQCVAVSLAESETQQIVQVPVAGHGNCRNAAPIKGFTECLGTCNSAMKYNRLTTTYDKYCSCCNIKSYRKISVPLICADGAEIVRQVEIPADCACLPCSESMDYRSVSSIDERF